MNRKNYFKSKIKRFEAMIWDLEFQRYAKAQTREEFREEYDQLMSRKDALDKVKLNKTKEEEQKKLDEQKEAINLKIASVYKQMILIDAETNGLGPCEEYPEGIQSINNKIDIVRQLIQKTKDFIRK